VTLTITEGAPAPIVPDVAVCNGEDIFVCFSIVNDGVLPSNIFVSPPNSSSQSSLIPVDADGCITIEPGDEAYVEGTYVVTYVDENGCTSQPGEGTIIIYDNPNPPVVKTECVCEGEDAQLTISNPVQGATYSWYDPAGEFFSDNSNLTVFDATLADAGVYTVTITDPNGCTAVGDGEVCVTPNPTVDPAMVFTLSPSCTLSDVQLMANANDDNGDYTYSWTGPNGFSSSLADPTIANATTASNGTYTVTVTNTTGCVATGAVDVILVEDPQPDPVISSTGPVCEGGEVILSIDEYEGSSVTYTWTLNGGSPIPNSSGSNTNELILNPVDVSNNGTYMVTVDIVVSIDGEGNDVVCTLDALFDLEIFTQPAPPMVLTPALNICVGDLANAPFLSAECTDGSDILWYDAATGGEAIGTGTAFLPTGVADLPSGFNTFYVECNNSITGCVSERVPVFLIIAPNPETPVLAQDGPTCEDGTIELCIAQTLADFPDANSVTYTFLPLEGSTAGTAVVTSDNCITVDATQAGQWIGQLAVSFTSFNPNEPDFTCESEFSEPIVLEFNAIPEPPEPTNSGPVCEGNDVTLFANGAADTYEWTDAMGNVISVLENPDLQGLAAGTYTFNLSITIDGCVSAVGTTTVTIHDLPIAPATAEFELASDCALTDITLHANASEGTAPYEYVWTGPNGFTSTLSDPTVANAGVLTNGTYTVFVTDANGCTTTGETEVIAAEDPVAQPIITSSGPECEGECITLSTTAYEGSSVNYVWTTPAGVINITGENTNVLEICPATASAEGIYTVGVTVDGCELTSDEFFLDIFDSPSVVAEASFTLNGDCSFSDITLSATASGGTGVYTYDWTGPNGFVSTLQNPGIANATTANNGTYTVVITDSNGCTAEGADEVLNIEDPENLPIVASTGPACEGECITLSTTAYEGSSVNYVWFTPDGTVENITGENTNVLSICPVEAAVHEGAYSVGVTIDGCELTSDVYNLDVFEQPIVSIETNAVCEGGDVFIDVTVENIGDLSGELTYSWAGPNGFSSNAEDVTIANATAADEGTYTVTA